MVINSPAILVCHFVYMSNMTFHYAVMLSNKGLLQIASKAEHKIVSSGYIWDLDGICYKSKEK